MTQEKLSYNSGTTTTYNYTYDRYGNILTGRGKSYTYGNSTWRDLLTAYGTQKIAYEGQTYTVSGDNITVSTNNPVSGNPISYYNGTRWTFDWRNGRELSSATGGGTTITYGYDMTGVRTSKTVGGTAHNYIYASGKLIRETYGSTTLDFLYDQNGNPYAMMYNGTPYYYILNLQGDVVRIVNASGVTVGTYSYDAWGKVTVAYGSVSNASTITNANPLRYRGYYYDTESGFYYLQSRYYDPQIGRFINADSYASTGQGFLGYNMFAYCGNNPAVRLDADGQAFETVWDIISLGLSIADVIANPADIWVWISLGGDLLDVLIPFVGGIGEATKVVKISIKLADNFGDLSRASEFGIKSYQALRKQLKGTGLHAHHIIEQRLVKHLGIDISSMLSVAVTSAEHQIFTNAWRGFFKYGMDYTELGVEDIWKAAQEIYKDYPELLEAARKILFG